MTNEVQKNQFSDATKPENFYKNFQKMETHTGKAGKTEHYAISIMGLAGF
jgi:hypothetical protein